MSLNPSEGPGKPGGINTVRSKKDLSRLKGNLNTRIAELEEKCRKDPLKKNPKIHLELEKRKRKAK